MGDENTWEILLELALHKYLIKNSILSFNKSVKENKIILKEKSVKEKKSPSINEVWINSYNNIYTVSIINNDMRMSLMSNEEYDDKRLMLMMILDGIQNQVLNMLLSQ